MTAQLALIDEPALYHPARNGPAYFGLLTLVPGSKAKHDVLPVEHMAYALAHLDVRRDSYISQGEFRSRSRTIAALRSIGLVWADLDDHALFANGDAWAVRHILQIIADEGLPQPSLIVHSGRGAHLKWLLDGPAPAQALARWSALEREIVDRLHGSLSADLSATDAARVLRIVGTVNTKTGNVARIVWSNDVDGELIRYSFDWLCEQVMPKLRPSHHLAHHDVGPPATELAAIRLTDHGKSPRGNPNYSVSTLHWGRYCDLRTLCAVRGWTSANGGVPKGYRDLVLFLMSVSLSYLARPGTWWNELQALALEFCPSLPQAEWKAAMQTCYRRLKETRTENGRVVGPDHRYRYTTARIIRDLGVSRGEMVHLNVLIDRDVALERERERGRHRRLAAGATPRTAPPTAEIFALAANGLGAFAIAGVLGLSKSTTRRILTTGLDPGVPGSP